tara:strand:+ start:6334 stop:6498 length:165 start_codon:yes stop_codon:yes gene_type:complete
VWSNGDSNLQLFGVIDNLSHKVPPVDAPSSFGAINNVLNDVVGRCYTLGVRFRF